MTYTHRKDPITIESPLEQLLNRPVLMYLIVVLTLFLVPIIALNLTYDLEYFFALILLPAIPVIYVENLWINKIHKNPDLYQPMYRKIEAHRTSFLAAGVIASFFYILIPVFLKALLTKQQSTATFQFPTFYNLDLFQPVIIRLIFFLVTLTLFSILALIAFYRVYVNVEGYNEKRLYFNSSGIIQTLLLYFLTPAYLGINVSLIAFTSQFIPLPYPAERFTILEQIFRGAGSLIIFIPTFILVIALVSISVIPNLLNDNQLRLSNSPEVRRWGITLGGIILISVIILRQSMYLVRLNAQASQFLNYLLMFMFPILGFYYPKKSLEKGKYCDTCSYFHKDVCPYCEDSSISNQFIDFLANVKHPECPNCGVKWDTLNRRCTNCEYTIVLSCENCSQTINPLWKKCNLCGEPRRTIPDLALNVQSYPQFARSRQILLHLGVIVLGIMVFLTIAIVFTRLSLLASEALPRENFGLFDDISFVIYFGFFILWLGFLLIRNRNQERQPILILCNKLIFIITESLFVSTLVIVLLSMFRLISFFAGNIFLSVLGLIGVLLIDLIILGFYFRSKLKWLIGFQPTIKKERILPEVTEK